MSTDPDNLEGPGRTPEEMARMARDLAAVAPTPAHRFRLMFGHEIQRERLLGALLQPTIDMMLNAGISRMTVARDKSVVIQMEAGETITLETIESSLRGS